ncbi:MAG: hypothetical protein R3F34_05145 [Planctomycetota bacterium]
MSKLRHTDRAARRVARIALAVWAPCVLVVVASLAVAHWAQLPLPETRDGRLVRALERTSGRTVEGRWSMWHVLYEDCPCSLDAIDDVLASERPADLDEHVLLVGRDDDLAERLRGAGIALHAVSADDLERSFGIVAAPLLVVVDPSGAVRYAGGYRARRDAFGVEDLAILDRLRDGAEVEPLPIFGCGVSATVQASVDPFGLKYDREEARR